MQLECDSGGFNRRRFVTKIFLRQVLAAEFIFSADFPEEISLDILRQCLRSGEKLFER